MAQLHEVESGDLDRCPTCLRAYEIVALKFRFTGPMALMVCASCGLVQSERTLREGHMPRQLASTEPYAARNESGSDSLYRSAVSARRT
jgi:hypothetical protein